MGTNEGECRCPLGECRCPLGECRCPLGECRCPLGEFSDNILINRINIIYE